jgi:hypothetical protein
MTMRTILFVQVAVIATLAGGASANTVVDFEAFADAQNINGIDLGGVTLFGQGNVVSIYANGRAGASFRSPVNSFSTGSGTGKITGVFSLPQTFVALWGGDAGSDEDSWQFEAFDATAGGNSLGLVQSGSWNGDPYRQLAITANGIMRFEARWTGQVAGVAYDDLEFGGEAAIPEPITVLGVMVGVGALGRYIRRRQTA